MSQENSKSERRTNQDQYILENFGSLSVGVIEIQAVTPPTTEQAFYSWRMNVRRTTSRGTLSDRGTYQAVSNEQHNLQLQDEMRSDETRPYSVHYQPVAPDMSVMSEEALGLS